MNEHSPDVEIAAVQAVLDEVASDRKNGATRLAIKGLGALRALAEAFQRGEVPPSEWAARETVERIANLRPAMGAIGALSRLAHIRMKTHLRAGLPVPEALLTAVEEEQRAHVDANSRIAEAALGVLGKGGIVATCSNSETVRAVLGAIQPDCVLVGDGTPLRDGVAAARALKKAGFRVEVVQDASLPSEVARARAVLVGADQVLRDGSVVNRAGTFAMALGASHFGVPFYVACGRIKLTSNETADLSEQVLLDDCLPCLDLDRHAPLFDVTPPGLQTAIFTEIGSIDPGETVRARPDNS